MPKPNDLVDDYESPFVGGEPDDDDFVADPAARGDELESVPAGDPDPAAAQDPASEPAPEPAADPDPAPVADGDAEPAADSEPDPVGADSATDDGDQPAADLQDDHQIPKWRLDQEARKRRALEKELEELRNAQQIPASPVPQPPQQTDYADQVKAALENVAEGDTDAAAAALAKVLADQQEAIRAEALVDAQQAAQTQTQQQLLDTATAEILEQHEFLVEGHEDFDPLINEQIIATRDVFYNRLGGANYHMGTALKEATESVLRGSRPDLFAEAPPAAPQTPVPDPAKAAAQAAAALASKQRAAVAQPKPTALAGDPGTPPAPPSVDVMSLTDAEFDALSEQELAKLRGDFYAG